MLEHPQIQGLGWFSRRSPDPLPSIDFYRDVMGLPFLRGRTNSAMFWVGETMVLWVNPGGTPEPEYTERTQAPLVPVFRVRALDRVMARLEAGGARFLEDLTITDGRIAYFVDPGGHITGIQERAASSTRPEDAEANRRWDSGANHVPGIPPLPDDIYGIGWLVMRTPDPDRAIAFYRDVMGFYPSGVRGAMVGIGQTALLEIMPGGRELPVPADRKEVNDAPIYRVHRMGPLVDRLRDHGVRFVNEPFDGSGKLAYFLDPTGQLVGLQERKPDSERPEDIEAARRWQARTEPSRG